MPNPKYLHAKPVSHVSFSDLEGPAPKYDFTEPPEYSQNARKEASEVNKGHKKFTKKIGKYVNSEFEDFSGRIYEFLISVDASGNELIGNENLLCLPCPDFCIRNDYLKSNRSWKIRSLAEMRSLFKKYYTNKSEFNFDYNLFRFYNMFKNVKIRLFEFHIFTLMTSYTLHQYEKSKELFQILTKKYSDYESFVEIKDFFCNSDKLIIDKHTLINNPFEHKNIAILRCDFDYGDYMVKWQDVLMDSILASSLRFNHDDNNSDEKENRFPFYKTIQLYSILYKNEDELIDKIPDDSNVIIVQCHGGDGFFTHYYGGRFFSGSKDVPMKNFIEKINERFMKINKEIIVLFFSCDTEEILNYSEFENTIACIGEYDDVLMAYYTLSFFSSYTFCNNVVDIHKRAKIFTKLFTDNGEIMKMKCDI